MNDIHIDIEDIRREPEKYRKAIAAKHIDLDLDELLDLDSKRRAIVYENDLLRAERNKITAAVKAGTGTREELIADARRVGEQIAELEENLQLLQNRFAILAGFVPGLPADGVPQGKDDADNQEIKRVGAVPDFAFSVRDHLTLAGLHGMLELDGARNIAGSRAYALVGIGALLEMAVLRFALDKLVAKGFVPVLPPLMVKAEAMYGTGYFPLGEDQAYTLEKDGLFLTGTSEVGMVAMHMHKTLDVSQLPAKFVGISPCFRREAGAAGRDTKGLYRVHQFQKVEQVVFCENDAALSEKIHYELLQNSEEIVQALELPYRVVAVCAGDMGLGQVRKHDIETWMPSRNAYGETHSCSTFHDFQARRLNIRYRDAEGAKTRQFVHSLNNTAIASPRILIALLENHQTADGAIKIPEALREYLGGRKLLEPGK
ncbi:MAG: serine--tRNA ligase [Candidatus Obscuribacterales bacterium]|nr:serine--tRNA ligase [Candidatus Obscuribacterales bacterium]